ncbi:MAG: PorP/SprF family type IX secretion system membrane protein [Bacteroidetes bacterium]|nr:PorP/SprF family type IX secretion system membrane protein [Bacteroidota bacterium]
MKKIFMFIAFSFSGGILFSQDLHYSMYTMAPLTLNPALCGNFTGDMRVINNYRTQWNTISKPYTTYSFGIDAPLPKKDKKKSSPDFFAVGFNVNVDKAGSTSLKNNLFNGIFSYNKSFDGTGASFFSFGFQIGAVQRSIMMNGQKWDTQWDNVNFVYDPTAPNGETLTPNDHYLFFDYGTGVAFTTVKNARFKMSTGLSVSHLSKPEIDFIGSKDKLYMKFAAHWNAEIALGENSNAWLIPSLLFVRQGPAMMINAGLGVKYQLTERSHYTNYQSAKFLSIGGMYRLGDAASGYIRLDIGPVGAAFNYDMNVSQLTVASRGIGALEFMLIYTGIYHDVNTRDASRSFF